MLCRYSLFFQEQPYNWWRSIQVSNFQQFLISFLKMRIKFHEYLFARCILPHGMIKYMFHSRNENLTHNNLFPMRDWHVKHMQDTVIRYLTGLSEDASRWQKRMNKQYGNLTQVNKRIDYDIKHGDTACC